jgi:DNA-binding LacI/PurR family transcriptional regulator
LEAIGSLGYRPNHVARALVTRRSGIIGVVTSESEQWGPSSALVGVERAGRP